MRVKVLDRERYVVTVSELLSKEECASWIELAEKIGFDAAPITTAFGFVHAPEVRNNTRVMLDDFERAAALWERVREHVPARRLSARAVGLNERFRFYRYEPGQYFRWHYDGAFERTPQERSELTLMIYLNGDCEGGATEFRDRDRAGTFETSVVPEAGKALLFQHFVHHQGAPLLKGKKYVLRTDVMYRQS